MTSSIVSAAAEALPFGDASSHGITVAQAFHWFDSPAAMREFHRVLRPGGKLAVFWNQRRIGESDLLREYEALIDGFFGVRRRSKNVRSFEEELSGAGGFSDLTEATMRWEDETTVDAFVGFARTPSYVRNALDAVQLADYSAAVRSIGARYAEGRAGGARLRIPYETVLFTAERE
ncbi:MAG: methyltransferase domain-containing protein [Planctomycetota bacterium]